MTYFISGGSRGIGEALVMRAAKDGHAVAFTYRSQADRAAEVVARAEALVPSAVVRAFPMDVRDSSSVERAGDDILDAFGHVDVAVCNAGINQPDLLVNMTDEAWHDVLQTNLTGAFYVARYFLPSMMSERFGRFIFMSSIGHAGITGQANYCASKAGLHGLASAIAKEYGRRGITANVVVPGVFDTDMSREGLSTSNRDFWNQYCPVGRLGRLDELSSVVAFLASEQASFINGQAIPVDGGLDWAP